MIVVSQLYVYPIKSCRGTFVDRLVLDESGPLDDRRYMLVDQSGKFVSQRAYPEMAKIIPTLLPNGLSIEAPNFPAITVENQAFVHRSDLVRIWKDDVEVNEGPAFVNEWFSDFLGLNVSLVKLTDMYGRQKTRASDNRYYFTHFADSAPMLLVNEASLEDLNARLEESVSITRFRPNVVISGADAFAEDYWDTLKIGSVTIDFTSPCPRCVMVNVDPLTAEKGREPLEKLAQFRKTKNGICFGINLVHQGPGEISIGDKVTIF